MKTAAWLPGLLLFAMVAAGCQPPITAEDKELAELGRQQVARLLDSFVQAVRAGKHEMLGPLLAPLKAGEGRRLRINLVQANWLELYDGYTLDYEEALDRVPVQTWKKRTFTIRVPGSNAFGEPLSDEFVLIYTPEGWKIRDFSLVQPQDGVPLHPPADILAEIKPMAAEVLQLLKDDEIVTIWYAIPKEDSSAHFRQTAEQGFWESIFQGDTPSHMSVEEDLKTLKYLSVWDWPNPDDVTFAYAAGDGIMAVYTLSYTWPERGIDDLDTLRIEIIFARRDGEWQFRTIHLRGKAIPYSQ
jgi:hypothetical protein